MAMLLCPGMSKSLLHRNSKQKQRNWKFLTRPLSSLVICVMEVDMLDVIHVMDEEDRNALHVVDLDDRHLATNIGRVPFALEVDRDNVFHVRDKDEQDATIAVDVDN